MSAQGRTSARLEANIGHDSSGPTAYATAAVFQSIGDPYVRLKAVTACHSYAFLSLS